MQKRNLLKMLLLNIITLGIYQFYWLYSTRKELVAHGNTNIPRMIFLFIPPLVLVAAAAVYALAQAFTSGEGNTGPLNVLIFIVAALAVIAWPIVAVWWLWQYCIAIEAITKQRFSRQFAFWLGILISMFGPWMIWTLIIQNEYNHLAKKSS